jgi:pimeloyl-ACP methyl ester carboxylesterase
MVLALVLSGPSLAGPLTVDVGNGVRLSAEEWGGGSRGVLLVHDEGGDRTDWGGLGAKLATAGFRVVALDLRGHGASSAPRPATDPEWAVVVQDLDAAAAWLARRGVTDLHVIAAGVGANAALHAASGTTTVDDLVLLSPSPNAHGLKLSTPIAAYGSRPLFAAAAQDDPTSAKAATWLAEQAQGPKILELYPTGGKGARLLNTVPSLEGAIVTWLNGTLLAASDPRAARDMGVKVEDEGIETTGQRLEDRQR